MCSYFMVKKSANFSKTKQNSILSSSKISLGVLLNKEILKKLKLYKF